MSTERLYKCDTSAKNESAVHTCMMRVSSHHRALYCYLLLSVWIFLLVAGMYKYIGVDEGLAGVHLDNEVAEDYPRSAKADMKLRRLMKICNPPSQIAAGSEGRLEGNHTLEGILVFLRHGDRGPMSHVRNISGVHCDEDLFEAASLTTNPHYPAFKAFVQGLAGGPAGRPPGADRFLGNFNEFPLHPPLSGECQLGQLTPVGLSQILTIGHVLKEAYADRLSIGNGTLSRDNTRLYTTRYRRTVQSAIAFLTAFMPPEDILRTTLHESYSVSFCFDDCACPTAERYSHQFAKERSEHLKRHPAVLELVQTAAPIVYDAASTALLSDPHSLRDAVLTYVCHGARLPCTDTACIAMQQVTGLLAYTEWEAKQYAKSNALKKSCLLRAYGVLRNVVTHMLSMVSERRPKVVLYSGHDMTLQYLTTALGVLGETSATPYYASRLVLEVYKDGEAAEASRRTSPREYYFRLVYNGRDLTNRIAFCRGRGGHVTVGDPHADDHVEEGVVRTRQTQAYLCPIESIIRFLHDDYFTVFNATNFKDACAVHS